MAKARSRLDGSSREPPSIGRKQPRPAENIAFFKGDDAKLTPSFRTDGQFNTTLANKVELAGILSLVKNEFPGREANVGGAAYNQFQVTLRKVREKRMSSQNVLKSFHATLLGPEPACIP